MQRGDLVKCIIMDFPYGEEFIHSVRMGYVEVPDEESDYIVEEVKAIAGHLYISLADAPVAIVDGKEHKLFYLAHNFKILQEAGDNCILDALSDGISVTI